MLDLQVVIGLMICLWTWIPTMASIGYSRDEDRRTREIFAIRKGPSLALDEHSPLSHFPGIAKAGSRGFEGSYFAEVRDWCEINLGYQPQWLYNEFSQSYGVFRNPDDAFHFKMRWF